MKYIDEFRSGDLVAGIAAKINELHLSRLVSLMEICGGHTIAIYKYGLRQFLPEDIRLISGPGCPVCVTDNGFIDDAISLSLDRGVIITTFGDLIRVPGSEMSLQQAKGRGGDIRTCYSPTEALKIAAANPEREIVFLGIGFETTAPAVAAAVLAAKHQKLHNFSILSAHKTMPAAMQALLEGGETAIDGFICPGHVSTITGIHIYDFIAEKFGIPCVVSGFEPFDMMETIYLLTKQLAEGISTVENQYTRSVRENGNQQALAVLNQVFEAGDAAWRGLGTIPGSGLNVRTELADFDAYRKFNLTPSLGAEHPGCICGEILRGIQTPWQCPLFGKTCTPLSPKGACMVSNEGFCATAFKFGKSGDQYEQ